MTFTNPFKTQPTLTTIAVIVSLLIIIKYGIIVLFLLILFYLLFTRLMLDLEVLFHPKHPYHKLKKLLRGCFFLGDDVWLDNELDSEFSSLTRFCKENKRKVVLFSEQIDSFAKAYKENSDIKVFDRIAEMQKAKILKVLPAVKAADSKPNPFSEYFKDDEEQKATNIGIIYEAPLPPKPKNPKMEFFKAITHYCKLCKEKKLDTTYVSKDPELKVRITNFMQENPEQKINIMPIGDFKKSFEYIDRFKISFIESQKKKRKARELKKKDRQAQLKNVVGAVTALSKNEPIEK